MPDSKKPLIHVVCIVNLEDRTGRFLYVTPANSLPKLSDEVAVGPTIPTPSDYELIALDVEGNELIRTAAQVFVASDSDEPKNGLIDQIIDNKEGTVVLLLTAQSKEIARFEAGSDLVTAATGVSLGAAMAAGDSRRPMALENAPSFEPGVSYTIEVRPEGDTRWHTIAIGVSKVELALDRNQFPNSRTAEVRVRRTNGFKEEIVADETVSLAD